MKNLTTKELKEQPIFLLFFIVFISLFLVLFQNPFFLYVTLTPFYRLSLF